MRPVLLAFSLLFSSTCADTATNTPLAMDDTEQRPVDRTDDVSAETPGASADIRYISDDAMPRIPSEMDAQSVVAADISERSDSREPLVREDATRAQAQCGNGEQELGETCDGPTACYSAIGPGWAGIAGCNNECTALDLEPCVELGTAMDPALSCKELASVNSASGVYYLKTLEEDAALQAYCDMPAGWTLVVSRKASAIPGPWGTFSEGSPSAPSEPHAIPFIELAQPIAEVRLEAIGQDLSIERVVAANATWESNGQGLRLQLSDGNFLVFSDQPSTGIETFCIVSGAFDTGYKCDGNAGQIAGVGLFDLFTEDDFCNCDSYGWKQSPLGCEAELCSPEGLFAVWIR